MAEAQTRSESIGKLVAALALAQLKFDPVLKDTKNPYYNSKYADLSNIIVATQGPLAENGLVVIQTPLRKDQDAGVSTMLAHSSGEFILSELMLPAVMAGKDGKPRFDSQSVGSAITYARRYTYQGIIGVAAEDDDGQAASNHAQQNKQVSTSLPTKAKPEAIAPPSKVNSAPATEGRSVSEQLQAQLEPLPNTTANAQGVPQTNDPVPQAGLPSAADLDAVEAEKEVAAATAEPVPAKPTDLQFLAYKSRASNLRAELEKHGFKSSQGFPSGKKLVQYFVLTAGVKELAELTISQWETVFSVLDNLVKTDGRKAVDIIEHQITNPAEKQNRETDRLAAER